MKSATVIGYTDEKDAAYCKDCGEEKIMKEGVNRDRFHPIFASSEWASIPICSRCNACIGPIFLTD